MRRFMLLYAPLSAALIAPHAAAEPVKVPGPHGGAAWYASAEQKESQDAYGYAGAYRAGDFVYLSGVVAGAPDSEPLDAEAFKDSLRRAFRYAEQNLNAAGGEMSDVIDVVTFHVWDSPLFSGDKNAHLAAVADVKREFIPEPHPAWTAIGVSELVPDNGLVEIRLIAYSPQ